MPADRPTDTNRLLALEQDLLRIRHTGGTDQSAQAFATDPAPTQNRLLSLANELLNYQTLAERLRSRTTPAPDSPSEETQSMSNDDFSVANQLLDLERSLLKQRGNTSNGSTDRQPNEARAYDFDRPIVFRDPTAIAMGVDGEIVTNQLMELERSLTAHKPDSPNGKRKKAAPETVTAMAFDFDEAIQLDYNSSAFDNSAVAQAYSYDYDVTAQSYYPESYAAALMDDGSSPEAFGLQDEPAAFEVEAFSDSGANQSATYPIATPPGAAIPVQATVVPSSEAIAQSVYSDAYDSSSPTTDAFAEDSFGFAASDDIADAEAFAADLQAILSGAKTYEPETKQTLPTTPAAPSSPSSPPPPAPEPTTTNPTPLSQSHAIFDQITHNMAYANAFDLGNISMEQRFDEFDRLLDREQPSQAQSIVSPAIVTPAETALALEEIAYAASADDLWSSSLDLWSGSMDLAATGFVESFSIPSSTKGESFDLRYDVPLIPQQPGLSCWAAAATMLIAWRDRLSPNPADILQGVGPWASYKSALQSEDPASLKTWGMVSKTATTYTVEGLVKLILEADGPLWVASDPPGTHVRVVTGIVGNGTPTGTLLLINDPWKAAMTSFQMPNPGAQYTETYEQFMQKQPLLARQKPNSQGIFVAYLQDPIGNINRAKATKDDDDIDES